METFFADNAEQLTYGMVVAVICGWIIMSLVLCFLGYVLYRPHQSLLWAQVGGFLGVFPATLLREQPTTTDYLVACGCLCVALLVLSWIFHRVFLAATIGMYAAGAVLWASGSVEGINSTVEWVGVGVTAVTAGGVIGAVVLQWTKPIVIVVTSLVGAACTVALVAGCMLWEKAQRILENPLALGETPRLLIAATLAIVGVAGVGIYVQNRAANRFEQLFTKPHTPSPKRSSSKRTRARKTSTRKRSSQGRKRSNAAGATA